MSNEHTIRDLKWAIRAIDAVIVIALLAAIAFGYFGAELIEQARAL